MQPVQIALFLFFPDVILSSDSDNPIPTLFFLYRHQTDILHNLAIIRYKWLVSIAMLLTNIQKRAFASFSQVCIRFVAIGVLCLSWERGIKLLVRLLPGKGINFNQRNLIWIMIWTFTWSFSVQTNIHLYNIQVLLGARCIRHYFPFKSHSFRTLQFLPRHYHK